ncbi:MAG TPA: YfhO family protein [Thermoanaerobaculia bacterium]|nr:YfhO family protein [Thermoanaerobaculia bacterium]
MKTAAAGAALALVLAVAFWPVVTEERSFLQMDLRYEHVPVWHAVQQALRAGESPFWIEGQYCGNPLLFTQEAPPFYPLTLPLLLTGAPANRLSDLFSLIHFWVAGLAAFLLLRDLKCDVASSLFGGVAWMLSARMVQSAIWPNALAVAALLPFVLLGIFRIGSMRRRSGIVITALSGGICLLAARPHVIVGAVPLLLASCVAAVVLSRRRWRTLADLALAGVLAAALGAPSVVPSAILLPETSRAAGLDRAERNPYPLATEIDQVFLPVDGPRRWPEAAAYPGVLVLILAGVGAFLALRRSEEFPRAMFTGIVVGAAIGLLFAFGEKGPLGFVANLPLIRGFRIPARYLTSWSLGLALASALALSALLSRARRPSVIAGVCVLVLATDLVLHARRSVPAGPSAVYSTEPVLAPLLRARLGKDELGFPRRVWSVVLPPLLWLFDDREKLTLAGSSEPLYGAIGMNFGFEMVGGSGPSPARWKSLFVGIDARRAELAGAGALVLPAPSGFALSGFPGLPRAVVVPEAVVVRPGRALAAVLDPGLDPRHTAVLEQGSDLEVDPRWTTTGSLRLVSRGPGRIKLAAALPGDGVLVVFNTFEKGWGAKVDGVTQPVVVADYAFQGVRIPAGRHEVELRYRPRGLAAGIAAAAVGALGLVICAFRMPPS